MDALRTLITRVKSLLRTAKLDLELDEELGAHIDLATEEKIRGGLSPATARRDALREFGGVTQTRERYREQRGLPFLEVLSRDLCYALRQLMKSPGFAITTVLTLAIGIGANTAIFSMMDAIVLRPLAVPDLDKVVVLGEDQGRGEYKQVALGNFQSWQQESRSFEELAVRTYAFMSMTGSGEALHLQAANTSGNFFNVLRSTALLGRLYTSSECQPGQNSVTVLSYGFWQKHLGGDPSVIGRAIDLDDRAYSIIGVLPRTAQYPSTADLFLPLAPTPQQWQNRADRNYLVIGRLKKGVTLVAAQSEMRAIAQRLSKEYPATNLGWSVSIEPLLSAVNGDMTPIYVKLMLAATGFLLLVVCANIANLQFVRAISRRSEVAVRVALGAGRGRLLRYLLTESLLLGVLGAAAGLVIAEGTLRLCLLAMPERVARYVAGWSNISLNGRALLFSLAIALAAGIASGLLPALRSLRINLVDELNSSSRTTSGNRQTHRLRNVFAATQIALSVLLVISAALMCKGMWSLLHFADRYHPEHVLTFNVDLPEGRYGTDNKLTALYQASLEKLRTLPGVSHAELTTAIPEGNDEWLDDFRIENRPLIPGKFQSASRVTVSSGYFASLGIRQIAGRAFASSDTLETQPVVVVSRKFAEMYFPGQDPLGHRIRMGGESAVNAPWLRIVGIVDDVNYLWIERSMQPAIYLNAAQMPLRRMTYLVTAAGDPLSVAPSVRNALSSLDPTIPLDAMQTYYQYLAEALTGLLYVAALLSADALIGLLLAAIGIFGVMANIVAERTTEIGVRMALGASPGEMVRMILRRASLLAGTGIAIGLFLAAAVAQLAANLLFGVKPHDPLVFGSITVAVAVITLLVSYGPARRAASVDPMKALRNE